MAVGGGRPRSVCMETGELFFITLKNIRELLGLLQIVLKTILKVNHFICNTNGANNVDLTLQHYDSIVERKTIRKPGCLD